MRVLLWLAVRNLQSGQPTVQLSERLGLRDLLGRSGPAHPLLGGAGPSKPSFFFSWGKEGFVNLSLRIGTFRNDSGRSVEPYPGSLNPRNLEGEGRIGEANSELLGKHFLSPCDRSKTL